MRKFSIFDIDGETLINDARSEDDALEMALELAQDLEEKVLVHNWKTDTSFYVRPDGTTYTDEA